VVVNRRELQTLADVRLREAQVLVRARQFSGAYYLAGYALECALKACIAKQSRRYDFPDKKVNESWTHDLRKLVLLAKIDEARVRRASGDDIFRRNWEIVTSWSPDSRYRTADQASCRAFLDAIMEEHHGLLPWIKQLW
jgi:HEPN domain-containing protein